MSSPIASKHSVFTLSAYQSAGFSEEICLERSDFGSRHFESVLAAWPCLSNVIPSDSKLTGRRKTCNWLCILHKVSNMCFFSKWLSTSLSSMLSFRHLEHVRLKIMWLKSSHNPEWEFKCLSEAIWSKSLGRNDVTNTQHGCWVLFKMVAVRSKFWSSLETNFIRKTCSQEAETSGSGLT